MGDLGGRLGVGPDDSHDIEAGGVFKQPVGLEERQGEASELPLLRRVDRLGGETSTRPPAGLDLHEDHRVSLAADEVDFPLGGAVPTEEDFHPCPAEVTGGHAFPGIPQPEVQPAGLRTGGSRPGDQVANPIPGAFPPGGRHAGLVRRRG